MSVFVIGSLVLLALALAFVFAPLWRHARGAGLAAALVVVAGTGLVYYVVGAPQALFDPDPQQQPASLEEAVDNLAAHLEANPDELEGWVLLGRSRKSQERFGDARYAFAQALRLAPEEPDLMVEYAEAIVLASPRREVDGEALALIEAALAQDPLQQRGLLLLGVHHQQAGRPRQAVEAWERLLTVIGPEAAPALRERIAQARAAADMPALADEVAPMEAAQPGMRIRVELNPLLRDQLAPGAMLFVIARQPDGPNMPVAVHRQPFDGFPVEIELSDANAMMPTLRLSDQRRVRLDARVSMSGDAAPRPGDLEAEGTVVSPNPSQLEVLVIDRVVPGLR